MNGYVLDKNNLIKAIALPSDKAIIESITEENKKYVIERNQNYEIIVYVEIKPRNKYIQGIVWRRI